MTSDIQDSPFHPFNSLKVLLHRQHLEGMATGKLLPPVTVDFDPTNKCNSGCIWCNSLMFRQKHPESMSTEHMLELAKFFGTWGVRSACFDGDTKVKLVNGTHKTFKQLVKVWNRNKKPFEVYSRDKNGNIVPGIAIKPRITRTVDKLIEITLDNKQKIKCTLDHKFMLRDGSFKEAQYLTKKDSLMPLYTTTSQYTKGYEIIYDKTYKGPTARLFSGYWNNNLDDLIHQRFIVHHKNFNKVDNTKNNLQQMTKNEHSIYHANTPENIERFLKYRNAWINTEEGQKQIRLNMKKAHKQSIIYWRSEEGRERARHTLINYNKSEKGRKKSKEIIDKVNATPEGKLNSIKQINKVNEQQLYLKHNSKLECIENRKKGKVAIIIKKLTGNNLPLNKTNYNKYWKNGYAKYEKINEYFDSKKEAIEYATYNHKIISKRIIKLRKPREVYCLTVKKFHNFALSSGIFVKNCVAGGGEPTLNLGTAEFLYAMTKNNVKTGFITNGIEMSEEQMKSIVDNCSWCGFSIDAGDRKSFKAVHQVDKFDQVLQNLQNLIKMKRERKSKVEITYKYLLHPLNAKSIYIAAVIASLVGCDMMQCRPVCWDNLYDQTPRKPINYKSILYAINNQMERASRLTTDDFKFYGIRHKFGENMERVINFKKCRATPIMAVYCADGTIQMCHDLRGKEEWILCRHDDPYEVLKVWGSKKHLKMMDSIDPNKCPRCTFQRYNEIIEQVIIEDKMYRDFP